MKSKHRYRASFFAGVVFLISAFGCGSSKTDTRTQASIEGSPKRSPTVGPAFVRSRSSDQPAKKQRLVSVDRGGKERMSGVSPGLPSPALPSPGRTNAFEFAAAIVAADEFRDVGQGRDLRVIGFIEVDQPSAMLVIDGKTHVLKVDQVAGDVSIEAIEPPLVRINSRGTQKVLSLFDRLKSVPKQ